VAVTDSESPPVTVTRALSITVSGPEVSKVTPDRGPRFGRTLVRISGTGLACPRHDRSCRVSVFFGSHRAHLLFFATARTIWVISPPGAGTVDVTVTVGGVTSQSTPADRFTYLKFRFAF
ncbi:MAG: IPT/TIG domain-containing protein, partial [Streptosporangiaceae bacterium]